MRPRLSLHDYTKGILAGNRVILGQAITLIESSLASDRTLGAQVLEKVIPHAGKSMRIGITGVPGVGKSTFIESFGKYITTLGKKLAVLTIDPSSQLTKGSILGDKTRMEELAKDPLAYIRPSASGSSLGGVANKTREAILLCEAAGFEVILVETVGVGQSEVAVKTMVDFFLLLMLAGAGDELQGIKKGIMEMADCLVITKADGENMKQATEAQAEYQHALHLFAGRRSGWQTKVLKSSALTNTGFDEVWKTIKSFVELHGSTGEFEENRKQQSITWFNTYFAYLMEVDFENSSMLTAKKHDLENKVAARQISAYAAARKLLNAYYEEIKKSKEVI